MPYTAGANAASGPYSAGGTQTYQQANNAETQYTEATLSFESDLFTAFVLTGLTAAKDGTTASKLNLASGTAYPKQSDGTLRQRVISAQSFTTSTPSTTYYLDLNPDGSLSWATAHSGTANYLSLCSVTTDGSSNINVVTDSRITRTNLFSAKTGGIGVADGVVTININCYNDGTSDRFVATGYAYQIVQQNQFPQFRFSTISGTAGSVITWLTARTLATLDSNGGGTPGNRIWEGTTDPGGNAAEGDIWLPK